MPASHHHFDRIRQALRLSGVPPQIRRVIVGVIGGTVLALGVALLVLPGPAVIVIPVGLAILATEFVWARRWLNKARSLARLGNRRASSASGSSSTKPIAPPAARSYSRPVAVRSRPARKGITCQ